MGKPVDDATLRETRDALVGAFAEQDRQFGAIPETERYEKFIDPILRKVEVDAASEPAPVAKADAGESVADKAERQGFRVENEIIGQFDLKTGRQLSGKPVPQQVRRREGKNTKLARYIFAAIRNAPGLADWRARMDKIVFSTMPLEWKATKYMEILHDFVRVYGNPLAKKDRKIITGGR